MPRPPQKRVYPFREVATFNFIQPQPKNAQRQRQVEQTAERRAVRTAATAGTMRCRTCVCGSVCGREREREGGREGGGVIISRRPPVHTPSLFKFVFVWLLINDCAQ